jgi:hypothetical protein
MTESFPGRKRIEKKYRAKMAPLERRLDQARRKLEGREALRDSVKATADRLRSVQVSDFRKALRDNSSDHPVPNWYLEGVYTAWELPPDWFITLLAEYGG